MDMRVRLQRTYNMTCNDKVERFWRVVEPVGHPNYGSDLSLEGLQKWGIISTPTPYIEEPEEEITYYEECSGCSGYGGYDRSTNCEEWDDWCPCPHCEGKGEVSI